MTLLALVLLAGMIFSGCSGAAGERGPSGASGAQGPVVASATTEGSLRVNVNNAYGPAISGSHGVNGLYAGHHYSLWNPL
jgi:hypothetical protein